MTVFPQPKVNPEALPWANTITDITKSVDRGLGSFESDNLAKLKGIDAMVQGLSVQVQELENLVSGFRPIKIDYATASGFNVSSAWGAKASVTVNVPAGYTNASVYAMGYGVIHNTPFSIGGRRSRIFMNGQYSVESVGTYDSDPGGVVYYILESAMGRELSGLGSTFQVNFDMWTNVSYTNANNRAGLSVISTFY